MYVKKYLVAVIALALLLAVIGISSAQYSDEITDPRGDVFHWRVTETGYSWRHNVERPDVDIRAARISEEAGNIIVSIEVVGYIRDEDNFWYHIDLEDGEGNDYMINFQGGYCLLYGPYIYQELEFSGVGTNTFRTSFSLEDAGEPGTLSISVVNTYEWVEGEETGEYYYDTAGPEADPPANGNGDTDDELEDALDDLFDMGRTCLLIAIIVVVIIVIIIIIVLIKFLKSDDKEEPPQQYQQPPQQQQQQPPRAPDETEGEIGDGSPDDW